MTTHAGFPSPAQDFEIPALDLHSFLIHHPLSTYIMTVTGDNLQEAGIFSGDYVIVDRSLTPTLGKIVIAQSGGSFVIKRLSRPAGSLHEETYVWGVVTYVLHRP